MPVRPRVRYCIRAPEVGRDIRAIPCKQLLWRYLPWNIIGCRRSPQAKEMPHMTTIGIIGSGHVGSNLARAAIAHGYDVVLSNSQGPGSLAGLVTDLGPQARAATPAQAAAAGDFAIVAIPLTTIDQVPAEPLAGKVVIATINYFPQQFGHIREIDDGTTT